MKPNAMLAVAAMSALLPLGAAAETDSATGRPQFFVSQRVWFADWEIGAVNTQFVPASAAQPVPMLRVFSQPVRDRRAVPLTGLGVSLDRWTLSTTIGWRTEFSDARLDGKASRSEYDVNLGYAVTPNISAVLVYKAGKSQLPPIAGSAVPEAFRNRQRLHGTGLAMSVRYPVAENWNAYGSASYAPGRMTSATGERFSLRYTVAEAGLGYRVPGAPANLSLTAGYRYQNVDFRNGAYYTIALATPPSAPTVTTQRLQTATKGWTMGLTCSF